MCDVCVSVPSAKLKNINKPIRMDVLFRAVRLKLQSDCHPVTMKAMRLPSKKA